VFLFLSILSSITLGGESLTERLRCLGFWLRGNGKCWEILPWYSELLLFREHGKINSFMMSLFPIIIIKEILGRNVALINFEGKIAIIVTR
jgi:hypothetical protein